VQLKYGVSDSWVCKVIRGHVDCLDPTLSIVIWKAKSPSKTIAFEWKVVISKFQSKQELLIKEGDSVW